jgi:glycosyltransferase involved in cell wall biosynthesis
MSESPLVTVLTPVYNNGEYMAECIESVLGQTYANFEYIVVNNRSTDKTLEIAQRYARTDSRIRVHDNETFLGVIENHNFAFGMMSPASKYCKVVSGDDYIFPECLERMVGLAEANPSVGMIGSYSIAGKGLTCIGLEYERKVMTGRDICRATLLGGPYVFGSPTSLMYRSDLIRKSPESAAPGGRSLRFYPNSNPHADTTACYQWLEDCDFGFVHQVLSYSRIHPDSQTSKSIKYGRINRAMMADLVRFGPTYLSPAETRVRLEELLDWYYNVLVRAYVENRRNQEFWDLQKTELREMGLKFSWPRLLRAVLVKGAQSAFRPGAAMNKLSAVTGRGERVQAQYYQ